MTKPTVKENITKTAVLVFETSLSALKATPLVVWIIPVLLCGIILLIYNLPLGWITTKPVQEIIAPTVISLAAFVAAYLHYKKRETFTLILACFVWALFLRELHLPLTNNGFYVAIVVIIVWACHERETISSWLDGPYMRTLLPAAFWTYIVTKFFDRHYVEFLPYYWSWHDSAEETLETCGHVMIFAFVILALGKGLQNTQAKAA